MGPRIDIGPILEGIRTGGKTELPGYSSRIRLLWKDIPVEPLLSLKEQLGKMGMADREAFLQEALISVASKRPGPFREIASMPSSPLWNAAAEIISDAGYPEDLDILIGLIPDIQKRNLPDLIRAIGRFRAERAVKAISPYLLSDDDSTAFEAATALRDNGSPRALASLKEALRITRASGGSRHMFEAIVREMERKVA
jgi:HEAT repeat protein